MSALWDKQEGLQVLDEQCLHCDQTDHASRNCPNKKSGPICFGCGERGHVKSACQNTKQRVTTQGPITCYNCGKEGHVKSKCPNPGLSSCNFSQMNCFTCGGRGHSASVCPSAVPSFKPDRPPPNRLSPVMRQASGSYQADRDSSANDSQKKPTDASQKKRQGIVRTLIKVSDDDAINRNTAGENFGRYETLNTKISDHTFDSSKLSTFDDAGLDGALMDVLRKYKFETPTAIQSYGIPVVMDGRDLLAIGETGSGKTATYLLPILNRLISLSKSKRPRRGSPQAPLAVVVAPTRELVEQLVKDGQQLARRSAIEIKECYGGTDFLKEKRNIERGTQLLIGTTGRIKHFLEEGTIIFDDLRILVLDEADEMLQSNFRDDVSLILSKSKRSSPQVLMFSATFPDEVLDVAKTFLRKQYVKIEIGVAGCAVVNKDVRQVVLEVGNNEKLDKLLSIINDKLAEDQQAKILVFVERKTRAEWLGRSLAENNVKCSCLHSDRTQMERQLATQRFQKGDDPVLVATSVAARGLDITSVTLVVNYDLPSTIDDYINRVGRTGRVGNCGLAIAFFDRSGDAGLAGDLRNCLIDAGESVPDFLATSNH